MAVSRRAFLGSGAGAVALVGLGACAAPARRSSPFEPSESPAEPGRRPAGSWQSGLLTVDGAGRLTHHEIDGLRLPDFGHAGYHHGERELPDVPVVHAISPVRGDNTDHLRAAIDHVGSLPRGPDGIRGALLLEAGTYEIAGTVHQPHSGVVLRGAGDGEDPATSTVLRPVGEPGSERSALVVGGEGTWDGEVPGSRTDVTSSLVRVGEAELTVADASGLSVGDTVILTHPCTRQWLDAVDGGGTAGDEPWEQGSLPIVLNRRIARIDGHTIELDVPVFTTLDRDLAQSSLFVWDRAGLVTEVGVEDLRIDIAYRGPQDGDGAQARHALRLRHVEDAWVQRCTVLHFAQSGVVTAGATRVTVRDTRALDPVGEITGGRRYNFNLERRSQQVLFTDCHASGARHAFISNGTTSVSGVVFHRTTATASHTSSEGHRQWTQGLLFDNHREIDPLTERAVALYNRGDYGTGHGWAAVHSVAWNTDTAGAALVVQRPPTAQNYAIGCRGDVTGDGPFDAPEGYVEGTGRPGLYPESLYEAQLAERLRG